MINEFGQPGASVAMDLASKWQTQPGDQSSAPFQYGSHVLHALKKRRMFNCLVVPAIMKQVTITADAPRVISFMNKMNDLIRYRIGK